MSTQLRQFAPADSKLLGRASEFPSESAAIAAAIAKDANARRAADLHMTDKWSKMPSMRRYDTIVIGGGIHGITYALNHQTDGPVLVLGDNVGGEFAKPRGRAFLLNSRNRRGEASIPGESGAINFIPGGAVQPRDIGGQEYQDNWDLAFAIRCSAMEAPVEISNARAYTVYEDYVKSNSGDALYANRIIIATGLGNCSSFQLFLKRIARMPFPLKRCKRVAVLGAGDSGKVAVEALLGQTPFVDTTLDEVERIDWFGQPSFTKEDFEQCERSRYAGIARFFPRENRDVAFKIRPIRFRGKREGSYVLSGKTYYGPYEQIIECTGFNQKELVYNGPDLVPVRRNDMTVAMQYGDWPVFKVGPAANISVEAFEVDSLAGIPANSAAIFRYAPRTALFAKEG